MLHCHMALDLVVVVHFAFFVLIALYPALHDTLGNCRAQLQNRASTLSWALRL